MFGLFRKTRQEILTGDRSRRYFRYALGELVLVVFGILIALQIDGWNDDRLEREQEREILQSMLNEIRVDRGQIVQAINDNSNLIDAINRLLLMVSEPSDDPEMQREMYLHSVIYTYWYRRVDFPNLTISQLSSGNNLFLIRNKQVRDAILDYKRGLDAYRHVDLELKHYFHVQEASQNKIFNLAIAKKAYEGIEQGTLNFFGPLDQFDPLVGHGDYLIDDNPVLLAGYYGDLLFYRTTLSNASLYLGEQQKLGDELTRLVNEIYSIP